MVADALSRQFQSEDTTSSNNNSILFAISSPVPAMLSQIKEYFRNSDEGKEFLKQFCEDKQYRDQYRVQNDLLYFQGRIVIPPTSLRQELLAEYHSSLTAGHSGIRATLARLAASFYSTEKGLGRADDGLHHPPSPILWSHGYMGHLRSIVQSSALCGVADPLYSRGSSSSICGGNFQTPRFSQIYHF